MVAHLRLSHGRSGISIDDTSFVGGFNLAPVGYATKQQWPMMDMATIGADERHHKSKDVPTYTWLCPWLTPAVLFRTTGQ